MKNNGYIVLFDYDSMIYKAVWYIATLQDIRKWFKEGRTKEWMRKEIVLLTLNRLSNMTDAILLDIEETDVPIDSVEYFLTDCPKSVRKEISPIYKANRKGNRLTKWVKLVRREVLAMNFAAVNPQWEADDLIKDRAVEIGDDGYIICSIDKDLHQIHGIHFDYYRPTAKDENGKPLLDHNGDKVKNPCRGLSYITETEASRFFWKQMLTGDATDNIKGLKGVGPKRAEKFIIEAENSLEDMVRGKYIDHFGEDEGIAQFEMHKVLIGLGIDHRP